MAERERERDSRSTLLISGSSSASCSHNSLLGSPDFILVSLSLSRLLTTCMSYEKTRLEWQTHQDEQEESQIGNVSLEISFDVLYTHITSKKIIIFLLRGIIHVLGD